MKRIGHVPLIRQRCHVAGLIDVATRRWPPFNETGGIYDVLCPFPMHFHCISIAFPLHFRFISTVAAFVGRFLGIFPSFCWLVDDIPRTVASVPFHLLFKWRPLFFFLFQSRFDNVALHCPPRLHVEMMFKYRSKMIMTI